MRSALLVLIAFFCIALEPSQAFAQSGTGGTKDGAAAPSMVYPIRPRAEPPASRSVPNVYRYYGSPPVVRLRPTRPGPRFTTQSK